MIKNLVNRFFKDDERLAKEIVTKYPFIHEYNALRKTEKRGAFCHAPSTNMYFSQTGEVKVCCHNMEFVAGKYPEQSLKEIWASDALKKFRDDMKNYKLGKGCEICEVDFIRKNFDEVRARHFDNISSHPYYPTQMEFLLTNTCNLECVMCKGEFSSSIRKNVEHLPPIPYVYDDAFIDQLEEFIPYLEETRFSGSGEAFLIDANYKIWEKIILINPKCKIMVQTNGTVLNNKVKSILEKGNFHIGVSLDSLKKEVFEVIRPNSKFEKVIENIHYFNNYCKDNKSKFNISTCVMRQNWKEMPDFVLFSNNLNAVQTFHKVWYPRKYALFNLCAKELSKIYEYLSVQEFEKNTTLQKLNYNHYRYFQKTVETWMQEAQEIEAKNIKLANYNIDNLKTIVFNKTKNFLIENSDDFEANVEFKHRELITKINKFLDLLVFDNIKEKALREMCRVEIKFVVEAFSKNSLKQLLLLSKEHIVL